MPDDTTSYKGHLRLRVAGLIIKSGKILLVRLLSPITNQEIWTPPGGGVGFEEPLFDALQREIAEETNIVVHEASFLREHEIIKNGFHAVELYYTITRFSGTLSLGSDPEKTGPDQILKGVRWFSANELSSISVSPDFLTPGFLHALCK